MYASLLKYRGEGERVRRSVRNKHPYPCHITRIRCKNPQLHSFQRPKRNGLLVVNRQHDPHTSFYIPREQSTSSLHRCKPRVEERNESPRTGTEYSYKSLRRLTEQSNL